MDPQTQTAAEKSGRTGVYQHIFPLFVPLMLLAILLLLNVKLFRSPIAEVSDLAANSIQIQRAKTFREMLGNYSRWHFHHPGPGWFYLFGWGEYVFFDFLRLTPAPFNAQVLTIMILNVCFIGAAFEIFRRNCPSQNPFALNFAALIFFICVVSRTAENIPLVSLWMPHVLLFCFPLFLIACASVATNRFEDLPIAVACGGLLVHAHMAQTLFVAGLSVATAVAVYLRNRKAHRFYSAHKRPILLSAGLVAIFAFPIVAELLVDKPNNLQAVLSYKASYQGQVNSWALSGRYLLSFFAHAGNPEVVLLKPSTRLMRIALSRTDVILFWLVFLVLAAWAIWVVARRRFRIPIFIQFLAAAVGFVSLLFLYWASRISGPLYNWNGFFFYSVQLLAFLMVISIASATIPRRLFRNLTFVGLVLALWGIFANRQYFRNGYWGSDEVPLIAHRLPAQPQATRIEFDVEQWPVATGVANQMVREHKRFCVAPRWAFMFGSYSACQGVATTEVSFQTKPTPCRSDCSVILNNPGLVVQFAHIPPYLPGTMIDFRRGGSARWYETGGWDAREDGGSWTVGERSGMLLRLPSPPATDLLLTFKAHASNPPQRPSFEETLRVNDSVVGDWPVTGARIEKRVRIPQVLARSGELRIEFLDHDPRSPAELGVSTDDRKLGLAMEAIKIIPAPSGTAYLLGSAIDFHWGGDAYAYETEGWAPAEEGGSWALGKSSVLSLNLPPSATDLLLILTAHAFTPPERPKFRETLRVNNGVIADWSIADPHFEKRVRVPRSLVSSGHLLIEFANHDPRSPADLGLSVDSRKLGLAVESVKLEPAESHRAF
jgi:hypothetical protein